MINSVVRRLSSTIFVGRTIGNAQGRSLSTPEDRAALFHEVLERHDDVARSQPLLVVPEDLHWADESSSPEILEP